MTDNDNLSQDLSAALRDVSPASHVTREAHIAGALAAIPARQKSRIPLLGIAAALLLALGVGSTLYAKNSPTQPVVTAHAIKVVPMPKNMSPDVTVPGFPHSCYLADTTTIALYTMDTNPMQVDVSNGAVQFKNNNSCAVAAELTWKLATPTMKDPVECASPVDADLTLLGTFDMAGVRYRVLSSSTDLMLFSCATNSEIGRTPHPDYDNVIE